MVVSFCVIAHNEERALKSLLNDIRNQSYPHNKIEVILVNSISTDKTEKLMRMFAVEDSGFIRVKILQNEKKIQAAGWNVAIQAAQGDIIMRVDAHAMIPHDFIEKNVKCIQSGEDISGGPRFSIEEENTPWQHTLLLVENSMFGSSIAPYRNTSHKKYVKSVFHGAYRKEVFQSVNGFDERLGRTEDNEIHYRIREKGYKISYDSNIISYQYIRSTWRKMIKQKYGNGYWIGLTLGISPKCFSVYHFVPAIFVFALLVSICFSITGHVIPLIILLCSYGVVNLLMSVVAIFKETFYCQYLLIPLIFLSLHVAYGLGTIIGIIKMPFWKRKERI